MEIFWASLNQIAVLFTFIAIGFVLAKCKILDSSAATVLSKLENNVFIPCLVLGTFMSKFTIETFKTSYDLLLISTIIILIMMPLATIISKCLTKDKFTQNIFTYGLAFANFGFMGNAVVMALFEEIFFEYLIFTLPFWAMIYIWAVPTLLIPNENEKQTIKTRLKSFLNPMFIAMCIGALIGIFNIKVPKFLKDVIDISGSCMSPVAMLLTGITVSVMDARKTFLDYKLYLVSFIRLIVIPIIFIFIARQLNFSSVVFCCALCSMAMPLGLNTIVVPSAYGKDTSKATGMAVISHLISVITIPIIFSMVNLTV